jgi:hypothetical protein
MPTAQSACAKATTSKCGLLIAPLILYGCSAVPNAELNSSPPIVEYAQGPGPFSFDCDAKSDPSHQLNIRSAGGALQVTGSFRFLSNRGVEYTFPYVSIALIGPTGDTSLLMAEVTNSDVVWFGFGDAKAPRAFEKEAFTSATIPFVLKIDQVGKVTGSIDGIDLPGGRNALGFAYIGLTCSTAHVQFSNVTQASLK